MYAIVDIAGQQFKVEKDQEIFVHRLSEDEGKGVEFDNVLLLDNDGKISVGTPKVDGAVVKAKVLEHMRADKVIVFHKKRRKGYQKENGHRQDMSKILIEGILTNAKKKAEPKKEEKKAEPKAEAKPKAEKKEAPKVEVKKETAPKAEAKKTETKKAAAPKAEAKPKAAPKAKKDEDAKEDN
jgi:large subunit ribosomal protein L21